MTLCRNLSKYALKFANKYVGEGVESFVTCVMDLANPEVSEAIFFDTVAAVTGQASDWTQLATVGNNVLQRFLPTMPAEDVLCCLLMRWLLLLLLLLLPLLRYDSFYLLSCIIFILT